MPSTAGAFQLTGWSRSADPEVEVRDTSRGGGNEETRTDLSKLWEGLEQFGLKPDKRHVLYPSGSRTLGAAAAKHTVEVQTNDVMQVTFDDGFRLFIRGEDFRKEFLESTAPSREAAQGIADGQEETWILPQSLQPSRFSRGGSSRDGDNFAIRQLEVFKTKLLEAAGEAAGQMMALPLCELFERLTLKTDRLPADEQKNHGWLYRCSLKGPFHLEEARINAGDLNVEQPILLWIHGTASSTEGSFGHLWYSAGKLSSSCPLSRLNQAYQQACAFEHRSLTVSPIANAIALAESLPVGARLHIVTHSRGGLVGELLCRAERVDEGSHDFADRPFDATDIEFYATAIPSDLEIDLQKRERLEQQRRKELEKLNALLKKKRFKIERFVRVACPALGTTLASGKLDRWFSFVLWGLEKAAAGNPFVEATVTFLSEFLKALLKERTNPAALPGLEAMMPGSGVVRMLNRPDVIVRSDLSVIAGDLEGDSWLERAKYFLIDRFYGGSHDLIVNTGSMYGGAERLRDNDSKKTSQDRRFGATFVFDQGSEVSHFRYFRNQYTVSRLIDRLLMNVPNDAQFVSIQPQMVEQPARGAVVKLLGLRPGMSGPENDIVTGSRPIVIVLPGIMGSQLAVNGDRVWVDFGRLAFGGLQKLDINADNVVAQDVSPDAYADLCESLRATHDVIRFPYDWRQSIAESGKRLAERLRSLLPQAQKAGQPVRFLAHSMGGLVLASLIRHAPDVWEQIRRDPSSRAVLLGTPLSGSHSIVQLLLGRESLIRKLALLDLKSSQVDLLNVITKFPGVLELLPFDSGQPSGTVFDAQYWANFQKDLLPEQKNRVLPDAAALRAAHRVLSELAQVTWAKHPVIYVAGQADQTPVSLDVVRDRFGKNAALEIKVSPRGDGRVLWDLPAIQGVPRWFMDCEHGALASHEPGFHGILELLQSGTTDELRTTEPLVAQSRGSELAVLRVEEELEPMLPTVATLSFAALGAKRSRRKTGRRTVPIKVSIVHGDLYFARYPVAVGHYQGDTIIGAEARLDRALDGLLIRRQGLGIYPGLLETCETFIDHEDGRKPGGAIIVGLGRVGELSPRGLENSFERAVLEYALAVAEHPGNRFDGDEDGVRRVRISTLLIGTGADSLTIRDSMESLLYGLSRAADRIQKMVLPKRRGRPVRVEVAEVEFLEVYEDRAIEAAHSLRQIAESEVFRKRLEIAPELKSRDGSLQRIRFSDAPGWWHRLQITRDLDDSLRFVSLTRKARAEVRLLPTLQALVQKFVEQATGSTVTRPEFAQTLFELLLPNALKEQATRAGHLALVLDDTAAALPWELLADRTEPDGRPLAVALGLLRQLETANFRERPNNALLKRACVIGDPKSEFVPLPGAEEEAREAVQTLSDHGFEVEAQIKAEAPEIVMALHRSEYRILHLSGHGVHEFKVPPLQRSKTGDSRRDGMRTSDESLVCCCPTSPDCPIHTRPRFVSGMVLGNGLYLTSADVDQMRVVPELVFINCCHLGKMTDTRTQDTPRTDRHFFASNIAAQFIRMGVKAVIAAGWAVDDRAAVTFAATFYQEILKGETFGDAVLCARGATWEQYPHLNTWGAYQCYGDPGWRLCPKPDATQSKNVLPKWATPAEVEVELDSITRKARTLIPGRLQNLKDWLRCVRDAIPEDWRERPEILGELGLALIELGEFEEALTVLEKAIKFDAMRLPPALLERLCDCRYRRAFELGPAQANVARELLKESLATIIPLCRIAPTRERFKSAASTYKRQFVFGETWADRTLTLEKMICHYVLVEHFSRPESGTANKTTSNDSFGKTRNDRYGRYTGLVLLSLLRGSLITEVNSVYESIRPDFESKYENLCLAALRDPNSQPNDRRPLLDSNAVFAWCSETELLARRKDDDDPRFWNACWSGQCPLLSLLLRYLPTTPIDDTKLPSAAERQEVCAKVTDGYARALERGASPRNRDSVFQHLSFVSSVLLDSALPTELPSDTPEQKAARAKYRSPRQELGLAIQQLTEELRLRVPAD